MTRKLLAGFALALLVAASGATFAQTAPTLSFTAQTTTGSGSVVPVLTWNTTPAATSCTASGATDWTGNKAVAGSVTLAAITQGKTYNLTCTWPADTFAKLTWTAPTLNTDGTAYTDPKGYNIHYGTALASLSQTVNVTPPTTLTYTVNSLTPGTWYFCIGAVNLNNVESVCSSVVNKTLAAGNVTRSVGIVVNPVPNAPTGLTVE